ncbi:MAG: uL22 family ribosomal protein [Candidatus Berkelbacteria bacterium]|nr:uL22 family ribosomal protein [Candidatus Berkelbacteria bacterium]
MEIKVKSKYLRISPRKLRPVVNFVRGMNAIEAKSKLKFQPNKGANMIVSLIDNAMSVVKSGDMASESFYVAAIACGDGPRLKRGTPVSKGRMAPIVKRQSHMTLTLSDQAPKLPKKLKAPKETPNGTKS